MSNLNRQLILAEYPESEFSESTFEWRESEIPEPKEGEFLVRNLFLSLDPAMRLWASSVDSYTKRIEIGDVMRGFTVGRVVSSKHKDFKEGDIVQGLDGWQDYGISNGINYNENGIQDTWNIKNIVDAGLPISSALSVLGHTALPAYYGLLNMAQMKEGQTVLVSGAAGACGSICGQLAKIKGCRAVGIAGGPEKCKLLVEKYGYDAAIDYKSEDLFEAIAKACPNGVDIFFDNVGGDTLNAALANINVGARILICGAISQYTQYAQEEVPGPSNYVALLTKRARMEGFIILDQYPEHRAKMESDMINWLKAGKIEFCDEIVQGLENAPKVINKLFRGENKGKLTIQIADKTEIERAIKAI
ncbi:NADP-dependent oxidoreductase [Paraglaciecola chathamensis]|jgi:NADPH-dependent curcumin reductase CurA|uniref:NADP-dependent oxidoreductase n=2 Tax=Paraglaciecola chathamensis TaxID=368405 RepID=A0A8H9I908_9ALTE|nr:MULTISPECIES: NADP-dependent oxidoreductase [Paraglaciecola]AEE24509.1 Alcohol dehydrogenase zinc-binding domain protein [Glaciecola sp. 4H-3-7+YE-5]GAC07877.1 probable NADP-dependent oxidoreductase P1 [Paraglaciecola agarilytica NO2]GGZ48545.1 NADP-dependent oxidoreductase [Paraglaciecola oceanifecundans]